MDAFVGGVRENLGSDEQDAAWKREVVEGRKQRARQSEAASKQPQGDGDSSGGAVSGPAQGQT